MLIGLLLAGIIVVVGAPLLLYILLWHTKLSELNLALAYLMSVAVLCVVLAAGPNDPSSVLSLTAFSLGFILTLPWSALVGWGLDVFRNSEFSNREVTVVMLFGAAVNAAILYFIAVKARRLIKWYGARRRS